MPQIRQINQRHAQKLEPRIGRRGLPVRQVNRRATSPPSPAWAAGSWSWIRPPSGTSPRPVCNSTRPENRNGLVVEYTVAAPPCARPCEPATLIKARRVHVQAHVAVRGFNEHIARAAGNLQVAFRLQLRGGLVVDHLVGAQNVVAIMDLDPSGPVQILPDPPGDPLPSSTGIPVAGTASGWATGRIS